jgi:hypothetical protein
MRMLLVERRTGLPPERVSGLCLPFPHQPYLDGRKWWTVCIRVREKAVTERYEQRLIPRCFDFEVIESDFGYRIIVKK